MFKKTLPIPTFPRPINWGGKELLLIRIQSNSLPPCGGGLGWGVSHG